jgi:gamma-butyrobetaine dioxygenase
MLLDANQIRFRLQAGEAVFFDNHRVMHARTAFSDPARHLQICNVSRESFHQKLRLAVRAQGCRDELRLKLPPGVCG